MSSLFDKLNLRPGERRLVVIAAGIVFVFLNFWLVFPHFGDLGRVQQQTREVRQQLDEAQRMIQREPDLQRRLSELRQQGATVATSARDLQLQREITTLAVRNGVQTPSGGGTLRRSSNTDTNDFFDEQRLSIQVQADEKNLVNFLYSLAQQSSLVRVHSMSLRTDPKRYSLMGNITFVASYQKRPAAAPAAAPARTPPVGRTAKTSPPRARATNRPPARSTPPPKAKPPAAAKQPTPQKPATIPTRMRPVPKRPTPPTPPPKK